LLEQQGYVLWKRDFLRFGISPFIDMSRLNALWERPLQVVFDVGANVGQFAAETRRAWPSAEIHSFEPHPRTFERLARSRGDYRTFRHPIALGDELGEVPFYEYGSEGGGTQINSLVPDAQFPTRFGYKSREIKVPCSTLDKFCAARSIGQIDFLKLDVEGGELRVLRGAKDMLSRKSIMAVYFEFNDLDLTVGATGGALMPIARYIGDFGLRFVCVYTDSVIYQNKLHVTANALFVLPG
jgi:FkbM family methyltransferase